MICPHCHHLNQEDDLFCTECGAKLPKKEVSTAKEISTTGCGCIISIGIAILIICFIVLYAEESESNNARGETTFSYLNDDRNSQRTAQSNGSVAEEGSQGAIDNLQIVVNGEVLMENYRPRKRGDTLLFPAMAITRAGNDAVFDQYDGDNNRGPGYTDIKQWETTKVYTMNWLDYYPTYGIMEENHEPFNPCYRYKTKPIVEGDEVYVDLDTIYFITALKCQLDTDTGILTLTFSEANLDDLYDPNDWVEIPYPHFDSPEDENNMTETERFKYIQQFL